ncbi:hypothetical protein GCM10010306_090350 [Streptomyces umbrinus]|uniref:LexA family protein n=1 Tax=Streptomyces umbrinus TaxID=67370 RepID=UPI00167568AA|nr:hypothetical protein [Streptomyces umbrinus]GHB81855.1 hypothetical protein GCM10010306_090350 [Streptomyces umbrinus]
MPAEDPRLDLRKRQILSFIRLWTDKHGFPPSMREIGQAVGLKSTSSVGRQLRALEQLGLLKRDPKLPRTYQIVTCFASPDPAPAPQGSACSLLVAEASAEGQTGTVFVLQVMLGPALGQALFDGALLTVQSAGSEAPARSDHATILGRVVAITHPCTSVVPLPSEPNIPASAQAQGPALVGETLPTPGTSS